MAKARSRYHGLFQLRLQRRFVFTVFNRSIFVCLETWNSYCERQRKLRAEYGTQKDVNRAIVSSININFNPQQSQQQQGNLSFQGGRQLINVVGPNKPQKVNNLSTIDFSKPPPNIFPVSNSQPARYLVPLKRARAEPQ